MPLKSKTPKVPRKNPKSNTRKNKSSVRKIQNSNHIVETFLEMLNTIKLYHWKTKSYAQHKATDKLYAKLNENIDTFIETLLGKEGSRIYLEKNANTPLDRSNTLEEFKSKMYDYREFLIDLTDKLNPRRDTDLLSIRDEMLSHVNQFLYLLTFE